jgi:chemotaxis protein CheC
MVGVYLQMYGDGRGQALFLLSPDSALSLVDLMGVTRGTPPGIGLDGKAALAEFGNVALSHLVNAVVSFADAPVQIRPSPPAVVVDMQGATASLTAIPVAATSDEVVIIETVLSDATQAIQARFWVLPDCATGHG